MLGCLEIQAGFTLLSYFNEKGTELVMGNETLSNKIHTVALGCYTDRQYYDVNYDLMNIMVWFWKKLVT